MHGSHRSPIQARPASRRISLSPERSEQQSLHPKLSTQGLDQDEPESQKDKQSFLADIARRKTDKADIEA